MPLTVSWWAIPLADPSHPVSASLGMAHAPFPGLGPPRTDSSLLVLWEFFTFSRSCLKCDLQVSSASHISQLLFFLIAFTMTPVELHKAFLEDSLSLDSWQRCDNKGDIKNGCQVLGLELYRIALLIFLKEGWISQFYNEGHMQSMYLLEREGSMIAQETSSLVLFWGKEIRVSLGQTPRMVEDTTAQSMWHFRHAVWRMIPVHFPIYQSWILPLPPLSHSVRPLSLCPPVRKTFQERPSLPPGCLIFWSLSLALSSQHSSVVTLYFYLVLAVEC